MDFSKINFDDAVKLASVSARDISKWGQSDAFDPALDGAQGAATADGASLALRRRRFYEGDHWQAGEAWTGLRPAKDDNSREIYIRLRRLFTSKNVVKEIVRRHRGAVLGTSPNWTLTPTEARGRLRRFLDASLRRVRRALKIAEPEPEPEPQPQPQNQPPPARTDEQRVERLAEIDAALVAWWDGRSAHDKLRQAVTKLLYAGRGSLRLFVPPGRIDPQTGQPKRPVRTLEDALDLIHVMSPDVEQCRVHTDPETQDQVGVYVVTEGDNPRAELTYLDESRRTVVRVVRKGEQAAVPPAATSAATSESLVAGEGAARGSEMVKELGGRLTIREVEVDEPLVSEQVIQNNQLINLAMTMCGHGVLDTGFSELFLIDLQMPTEEVADANSPTGKREVPKKTLDRGVNVIHDLKSVPQKRPDGGYDMGGGSVTWREPSKVEMFADAKRLAYENILEEAQQLHALLSSDAAPSGESRIQALADFIISLKDTKERADDLGRWLLSTALAVAANLLGKPTMFDDLVVSFDCKIDTGKLTPSERTALLEEVAKRLRSRQSAMILLGIDDPDAELRQIEREQQQGLSPAERVNVERQQFLLERDRRADQPGGAAGVGARIEEAARGAAQGNGASA